MKECMNSLVRKQSGNAKNRILRNGLNVRIIWPSDQYFRELEINPVAKERSSKFKILENQKIAGFSCAQTHSCTTYVVENIRKHMSNAYTDPQIKYCGNRIYNFI